MVSRRGTLSGVTSRCMEACCPRRPFKLSEKDKKSKKLEISWFGGKMRSLAGLSVGLSVWVGVKTANTEYNGQNIRRPFLIKRPNIICYAKYSVYICFNYLLLFIYCHFTPFRFYRMRRYGRNVFDNWRIKREFHDFPVFILLS